MLVMPGTLTVIELMSAICTVLLLELYSLEQINKVSNTLSLQMSIAFHFSNDYSTCNKVCTLHLLQKVFE